MSEKFKKYLNYLLNIGLSPTDGESLRLKKISIAMVPVIIGPVGFVWGLIYLSLGHTLSAAIPIFYTLASIFTLWDFSRTKNISFIQNAQMTLILILPFLLMWSLGGFAESGYVMIWAFFAPISAIIHDRSSKSLRWFYAFITLVVISTLIDQYLIQNNTNPMPQTAIELFFFLNVAAGFAGIYFLLKHFINQSDKNADQKLKMKQDALQNNTRQLFDNLSYLQSYKDTIDKNLIVTKTDLDGKITFANDNFYKISGFTEDEAIGKTHNIIRHPENLDSIYKQLWDTVTSKKTWHGRIKNQRKDGTTYWIDTTIAPILDRDENIVEYIAIRHDITKLISQQDELKHMLYFDQLTGLENRNALISYLSKDFDNSFILINIDNFSQINDLYGHDFGNKVLIQFSKILKENLKSQETCKLFRLSGDEFVILTKDINHDTVLSDLELFIKQIGSKLIDIDEEKISLNITIGVSFEENNMLLSTANTALKIARRTGKNIVVYDEALSLKKEYENNIKWIKTVKDAIKDDRITVFFQPIVNNSDGVINKYETLIRLINTDGSIITPYFFLEIAKKAKLYKELTKIVIKKSFEAFKDNEYEFSINITIDDILDTEINEYIYSMLKQYNISNRVIFEIVETEGIEKFEDIEKFINMVKSLGCKIAIDDFGTGYSNFEYLMKLQADFIKIDGSIIKEILIDKKSELITSAIVSFAKEMNIQTIGEFVEDKEISEKVKALGVDKSQGYYYDKPKATLD